MLSGVHAIRVWGYSMLWLTKSCMIDPIRASPTFIYHSTLFLLRQNHDAIHILRLGLVAIRSFDLDRFGLAASSAPESISDSSC